MLFTHPTSARIVHNAHLIEAKQARSPYKRTAKDSRQPSAGQRFLSHMRSFRLRGAASSGFLSDSHELFADHDRSQLAGLGQFFTVIDVPAGRTLGQQGHIAREFVTILHGEVGVTIDGIPHAVLDDGSHFGAVPLLSDQLGAVHSASFTVMTPTRIAVADAAAFHSALSEFPLIDQRVRAMTDVRRAYLAGLAQNNAAEQAVRDAPTITEYPVHVVEQVHHA